MFVRFPDAYVSLCLLLLFPAVPVIKKKLLQNNIAHSEAVLITV